MITLAMLANLETRFELMVSRVSSMPESQGTNDATLKVISELNTLVGHIDRVLATVEELKKPVRQKSEPPPDRF
jgi:hypothetical protein